MCGSSNDILSWRMLAVVSDKYFLLRGLCDDLPFCANLLIFVPFFSGLSHIVHFILFFDQLYICILDFRFLRYLFSYFITFHQIYPSCKKLLCIHISSSLCILCDFLFDDITSAYIFSISLLNISTADNCLCFS